MNGMFVLNLQMFEDHICITKLIFLFLLPWLTIWFGYSRTMKSELPGRSFYISLPLADIEQLSEEFVVLK